jgi:hypothetical protein
MKISMYSICTMFYYLMFSTIFNMSLIIEKQEEGQQEGEVQIQGMPVCGANLSSPVVDQAQYIKEIHFRIGNRTYIENAD